MPSDWPGFKLAYTVGSGATASVYRIAVTRNAQLDPDGVRVRLDGHALPDDGIELIADGHDHAVVVETH